MTCPVAVGVMLATLLVAVSLALYANYRWMKKHAGLTDQKPDGE